LFDRNWKNNSREFITVPDLNDGQDVIHKIQKALKVQEISQILYGNLATEVVCKN
jgi:dihydroxy-acid dehydratase